MISRDIQSLTPGTVWEGLILDGTDIADENGTQTYPGAVLAVSNSTNPKGQPWLFGGTPYQPFPMQTEGWEMASSGALPTPKITVANIGGILSGAVIDWNDLCAFKVKRVRTFTKYLDPENWDTPPDWLQPDENAYRVEDWIIANKELENRNVVQWALCSPWDRVAKRQIPGRFILSRTCPAPYKSAACGWVAGGGSGHAFYFDANDNPCSAGQDRCSNTLNGCRVRWQSAWGGYAYLTYNGFPGTQTKDVSG